MKISAIPFHLELIHPFRISDYTRTNTPIVFLKIELDKLIGIGECSMPPYLGETIESALKFTEKVDLEKINLDDIELSLKYIDSIDNNNNAIKAAFDIAIHDLYLKKNCISAKQYFNSENMQMPYTSFTIGIDSIEIIKEKVIEADRFKRIKIKLGTENDKEIVNEIRKITSKEIVVDANRAWSNKEHAAEMVSWLSKMNCLFVEQPMPVGMNDEMIWLKSRAEIPLFADESCKRLNDIELISECFHGINIKLMKSTGLSEAYKMINKAKSLSLKTMIGCMSESSVGILAAASLAPYCDFADLDSVFMVNNNPFFTPELLDGRILMGNKIGIGYEINEDNILNL